MVHSTDMGDCDELNAFDLDVTGDGLALESVQEVADPDFV